MRVLLYHLLTTWMVLVTHALHFLEASSLLMWKPLRIAFFLLKRWYSMAKHTLESYGRSSRHYPYPTSISYISIPNAHQSTALLCPLLWIISGARYSGVPHKVHVLKRKLKNVTHWNKLLYSHFLQFINLPSKSIRTVGNYSLFAANPQDHVHITYLSWTSLANPKSVSLTCPSLSRRIFSGFKSRYTILLWWR